MSVMRGSTTCSRCGETYPNSAKVWIPLDGVVHKMTGPVCEDCLKPSDVVAEV